MSNKKTVAQDEQQLNLAEINRTLSVININLKSIASSLEKISSKGIDIYKTCITTNEN